MPFTTDKIYLTDGGLETVLIFEHGFDLPEFASFPLINDEKGVKVLHDYYLPFIEAAKQNGMGFILESPTWRASQVWADKLGYTSYALYEANVSCISLLKTLRDAHTTDNFPMLISGCIGPYGDGYIVGEELSAGEAKAYHRHQVASFKTSGVDMITAITMTNIPEAIGIVKAAKAAEIPVVISFTVETDGTLPSGDSLQSAIESVDKETEYGPAYYMINCAHPSHFESTLSEGGDWLNRIQGIRANASMLSHAELDEAEELHDGNPVELGQNYRNLMNLLPNLRVLGGCCGTDHRHIREMGKACSS